MTKTVQINIRVEESQKELWERASKMDRRTLADWIRIVADDAAEKVVSDSQKGK